jgi:hypothetical protein
MSVVNIAGCCHESEDYCTHNRQKNEGKNQPPETNDGNRANDCPDEFCAAHMHCWRLPFPSSSMIADSVGFLGTTFGDVLVGVW